MSAGSATLGRISLPVTSARDRRRLEPDARRRASRCSPASRSSVWRSGRAWSWTRRRSSCCSRSAAICAGARLLAARARAARPRRRAGRSRQRGSPSPPFAVALWSPGCRRGCCCRPTGVSSATQHRRRAARDRGRAGAVRRREPVGRARPDARRARPRGASRRRSPSGPPPTASRRRLVALIAPDRRVTRSRSRCIRRTAQLFWGLVLLLLAVAWLWIERLHGARRNLALAVALGAGALALPVAARAGDEPLFDYQSWDWFGGSASVTFQWDHDYGPLGLAARRRDDALGRNRSPAVLEGERARSLRRLSAGSARSSATRRRLPSAARAQRHPGRGAQPTASRAGFRRPTFRSTGCSTTS